MFVSPTGLIQQTPKTCRDNKDDAAHDIYMSVIMSSTIMFSLLLLMMMLVVEKGHYKYLNLTYQMLETRWLMAAHVCAGDDAAGFEYHNTLAHNVIYYCLLAAVEGLERRRKQKTTISSLPVSNKVRRQTSITTIVYVRQEQLQWLTTV